MAKHTKRKKLYIFIAFFILAGICNAIMRGNNALFASLMFSLNFSIYGGLLVYWMESVRVRLLPTRCRAYILTSAVLMLFFLILKICKYRVFSNIITPSRYIEYLYLIPTLLIPTLFLMASICISRGEDINDKGSEKLLLIPSVLLCLLAITNDLHKLVYIPRVELSAFCVNTGTYSMGILLYLIYIWIAVMALYAAVILFRVTRKRPGKIVFWMIAVLLMWAALECVRVFILIPSGLPRMYNTPEIRTFSMLAILEICIRSRLIPHNENYAGFLSGLKLPVLMTDGKMAPVFCSAVTLKASDEEMRSALDFPVYTDEYTKLSGIRVGAGYVFWNEDEKELHKATRRLEEANAILSEENDLIRVENELKEKKARLDAEAKVYDRIASVIYPKQKRIEQLLESIDPKDTDFGARLGEACVLNAYSKRKSNLLLISQDNLPKSNRELYLALQETARFLKCCGIEAAAVGEEYTDFPLSYVHELYDDFETLIEAWLPYLKRLTVSLTEEGIRIAAELTEAAKLPDMALFVKSTEADGFTFLTIYGNKGGEGK